jgi:hypothetical protein
MSCFVQPLNNMTAGFYDSNVIFIVQPLHNITAGCYDNNVILIIIFIHTTFGHGYLKILNANALLQNKTKQKQKKN